MQDKKAQHADFVKLLNLAIKRHRLYGETHPSVEQAVTNLLSNLQLIQDSDGSLTLGFSEAQLIVNEHPLDDNSTGVPELKTEFSHLRIESLVFERGVNKEEIRVFLSLVTMPRKTVEERGGFHEIFQKAAFQNILLRSAVYKRVEENEEITSKSEVAVKREGEREENAEAKRAITVTRMDDVIDHCARGTEGDFAFDHESLAHELGEKTSFVARRMVERAQDLPGLRLIVEAVGRFLSERLAIPFIEQGRDFSQAVSVLGTELKRVLKGPDVSGDFEGAADELVGLLDPSADKIRLKLLLRAFDKSRANFESFARKVARVLRNQEAWARLREPLKEKLAQLGIKDEDLERLLKAAEEARVPRRVREPQVPSQELAELRRLRDRFDEELARRLEAKTAALEQERRRAIHDKERLNAIIRKIGQALVVVDAGGRIQFMNAAAEMLLGTKYENGHGTAIGELLKDEHLLALAKGPLQGQADWVTKEIELKSPNDETRRILQASSGVIQNEDGEIVGQIAVLNDVTKQKKLEGLKSRFIVNVSHELRTPLTAINHALDLLFEKGIGGLSSEQKQFLFMAQQNVFHLSKVINDVLDIAKLEAGRFELRPVSCDLKRVLNHAMEMLRVLIEEKRLVVEARYPEEDVTLWADPDRLIQVITNLLGNAIKFTPEMGEICIEADSNWSDQEISPEPCIAISVRDTGIGIAEADQKRIFEKFEQSSQNPYHPLPGTGLGLALSKEIVELHGGKIWVESKEGTGSRFTFAIPRRMKNQTPH